MSSIIQCDCGAKIRVPTDTDGKRLRCPACRQEITPVIVPALSEVAATPEIVAVSQNLQGAPSGVNCPICLSAIHAGEPEVTCSKCDQVHHEECWVEVGGCSTYGCKMAPADEKEEQPRMSAWGDSRKQPHNRSHQQRSNLACLRGEILNHAQPAVRKSKQSL
jgi:hypothetical protein